MLQRLRVMSLHPHPNVFIQFDIERAQALKHWNILSYHLLIIYLTVALSYCLSSALASATSFSPPGLSARILAPVAHLRTNMIRSLFSAPVARMMRASLLIVSPYAMLSSVGYAFLRDVYAYDSSIAASSMPLKARRL